MTISDWNENDNIKFYAFGLFEFWCFTTLWIVAFSGIFVFSVTWLSMSTDSKIIKTIDATCQLFFLVHLIAITSISLVNVCTDYEESLYEVCRYSSEYDKYVASVVLAFISAASCGFTIMAVVIDLCGFSFDCACFAFSTQIDEIH